LGAEIVHADAALVSVAICEAPRRRPSRHLDRGSPARARKVVEVRVDDVPAELSLLLRLGRRAAVGDEHIVPGEDPQRGRFGAVASEDAAVELARCAGRRANLPFLLWRGRPDAVGASVEVVVAAPEFDVLPLVLEFTHLVKPGATETDRGEVASGSAVLSGIGDEELGFVQVLLN